MRKKDGKAQSGCHENDIRTADSRPFIQHKRLMFHLPYCHRIARKVCSTAKVVRGIGDQFLCRAASGIEICVETVFIRVDRYIDALMFTFTFKNALAVCQEHRAEGTVINASEFFLISESWLIVSERSFHSGASKHARRAGSPSSFLAFAPHSLP